MFRKKKDTNKYKWPIKRKIVAWICALYIIGFSSFLFLFYGPIDSFKEFWITSAMTTMSHQYLATWIYSEKYIEKVLANNIIVEVDDISDPDKIKFRNYSSTIYRNQYEKEILTHEKDDLYKVINISGNGYQGFLVAIYDPSRIHIATTAYLGQRGESILTVSKRENAIVAMNASGFYDPNWNGNGATPHGAVISNGVVVSEFTDIGYGGFIGFDRDNKLILGNMTTNQALEMGLRDAIEFGPFLIINGQRSFIRGNGGWGTAPRTAIGQRQDGIVLFVVINGRLASSIGADMIDLCDIMENYGAYNAANLDGGSSSELVINQQIINTPVAGGETGLRDMPTFWVVK